MADALSTEKTQVLIVGGGPVGLSAAIELGRRGIRTIVIEQNERVGQQPRAKTTNVRSMEHMRRWGIAERIRAASPLPADHPTDIVFATRLFGHRLALIANAFYGARVKDERFSEPAQWIPQYSVETVLRDFALTLPSVSLRFGMRLDAVTQSAHGVDAGIVDVAAEKHHRIRATYMIAADGARSTVRKLVGVHMEGAHAYAQNLNLVLRIPGLGRLNPQPCAIMYWLINPDAPGVVGPMDRGDTWYAMMALGKDAGAPTESTAKEQVRRALGIEIEMEVLTYHLWAAHSLIADRYRKGRIFLAGDACHLHPPFGGYGMNMGIADAVDLGWKLAATLNGWGGSRLLASYQSERRPIHQRVINEAVENYAAIPQKLVRTDLEGDDLASVSARKTLGAHIFDSKPREFKTLGVVLGDDYSASPIVIPGSDAPPPAHFMNYVPTAHPGRLAPHLWLADGASLYDRFGDGYTLLVTERGAEHDVDGFVSAARERALPLAVAAPEDDRLRDLYGARLVLIRPDQHVAWRGERLDRDPASLLDRVRGAP